MRLYILAFIQAIIPFTVSALPTEQPDSAAVDSIMVSMMHLSDENIALRAGLDSAQATIDSLTEAAAAVDTLKLESDNLRCRYATSVLAQPYNEARVNSAVDCLDDLYSADLRHKYKPVRKALIDYKADRQQLLDVLVALQTDPNRTRVIPRDSYLADAVRKITATNAYPGNSTAVKAPNRFLNYVAKSPCDRTVALQSMSRGAPDFSELIDLLRAEI